MRLQITRPVTQMPLLLTGKIFSCIISRPEAVSASTYSKTMGYILSSQTAKNIFEKGIFKASCTAIYLIFLKMSEDDRAIIASLLPVKAAARLAFN